jgi:2-deoxy-D-gluconate 3-dehydrogenase
MFEVAGKKAIVTGGSRGLGKAMASGLLDHGCEVVIMASNPETSEIVAQFAKPEWKYHCVITDISEQQSREEGFGKAIELLNGRIDILVNSAGMQRKHKCEDFPLDDWNAVINLNLTASFAMCQLAGREMLKQGSGKIINIASMGSYVGSITVPAYVSSKGAIVQMTKALSNEWASRGINVNAIAPGYMLTELSAFIANDEKRNAEIVGRIPMGRWGQPEDLIGTVLFLSSSASDYISGNTIPVDGGFLGR